MAWPCMAVGPQSRECGQRLILSGYTARDLALLAGFEATAAKINSLGTDSSIQRCSMFMIFAYVRIELEGKLCQKVCAQQRVFKNSVTFPQKSLDKGKLTNCRVAQLTFTLANHVSDL